MEVSVGLETMLLMKLIERITVNATWPAHLPMIQQCVEQVGETVFIKSIDSSWIKMKKTLNLKMAKKKLLKKLKNGKNMMELSSHAMLEIQKPVNIRP